MSRLGYQLGFTLGTITREFLREVKKAASAQNTTPSTDAHSSLPGPCLSSQAVDDLSQVPAIVRKGVDLHQWYEANTKPVSKPAMGALADLI